MGRELGGGALKRLNGRSLHGSLRFLCPNQVRPTKRLRCQECGQRTSRGKPYCLVHIKFMPYAAALLVEMELREEASRRGRQLELHLPSGMLVLSLGAGASGGNTRPG